MKKIIFAIVLALIAILTYFKFKNTYEYASPKMGSITDTIYGLGKVKSRNIYEAKIGITAKISKIFVTEGQTVSKSEPLISFYGAEDIRAPFEGTITNVNIEEGELAQPSTALIILKNLSNKYIEVSLEQSAALKVKKLQSAKIIFDITKNQIINGSVTSVFPRNDEFIAHIEAEKINDNILPGMTADTIIEVGTKENVLLIPLKATNGGKVSIMRDGKIKKIPVTIGHTDQFWAQVIEGDIKVDDQLLIKKD